MIELTTMDYWLGAGMIVLIILNIKLIMAICKEIKKDKDAPETM